MIYTKETYLYIYVAKFVHKIFREDPHLNVIFSVKVNLSFTENTQMVVTFENFISLMGEIIKA